MIKDVGLAGIRGALAFGVFEGLGGHVGESGLAVEQNFEHAACGG